MSSDQDLDAKILTMVDERSSEVALAVGELTLGGLFQYLEENLGVHLSHKLNYIQDRFSRLPTLGLDLAALDVFSPLPEAGDLEAVFEGTAVPPAAETGAMPGGGIGFLRPPQSMGSVIGAKASSSGVPKRGCGSRDPPPNEVFTVSPELKAIVGAQAMTKTKIYSRIWKHIFAHSVL